MTNRRIDNPILNSPFAEPSRHFAFDAEGITDEVVQGRRPSSHLTPIPPVKRPRKPGEMVFAEETAERVVENEFVNQVRARVDRWRRGGYQNTTATTRRLLAYWNDPNREKRFFFCQIEALETAIYLSEAAHKDTGGAFFQERLRDFGSEHNAGLYRVATKMATGTGKTVVMAMLIAWQTLNKAANPQDGRYTDAFLVVCPSRSWAEACAGAPMRWRTRPRASGSRWRLLVSAMPRAQRSAVGAATPSTPTWRSARWATCGRCWPRPTRTWPWATTC